MIPVLLVCLMPAALIGLMAVVGEFDRYDHYPADAEAADDWLHNHPEPDDLPTLDECE